MTKATPKKTRSSQRGPAAGELELIECIRRRVAALPAAPEVAVGIGDDCAVLRPNPADEIVVTTDFSLEGRHFRRDWHPPASVGHRTLARGLSDIAAMGARPLTAFLSLALPRDLPPDWLDGFLDGLLKLAARYGITLAGGDTSESPANAVLADIVVLGGVPRGTALRRSGARPGDLLYCTGRLGGAARELTRLSNNPERFRAAAADGRHPHLFPEPRLATGMALRERGLATACMDLSDGLSTDLAHLCTASEVAAELDYDALPRATTLRGATDAEVEHALLHGGEDYELLFAAAAATAVPVRLGGVAITRIGRVVAQRRGTPRVALWRNGKAEPLAPAGWEHFRS